MSSSIQLGDYVGLLDGTEKGYVIKMEKKRVWIETTEGFEISSNIDKLVKYDLPLKHTPKFRKPEAAKLAKEEEFPIHKKPVIKKVVDRGFKIDPMLIGEGKVNSSKKHVDNIWEIDLHVEELTDHYKHLTNGEIVDIQLKHARSIIEKARINKINKIVFIHGKGKGTLRLELLHLLDGYTFLEHYDASFKRYGGGATEVRIFTSKA